MKRNRTLAMRRTLIDITENGTTTNKSIKNSLGQPFIGVGVLRSLQLPRHFFNFKNCEL